MPPRAQVAREHAAKRTPDAVAPAPADPRGELLDRLQSLAERAGTCATVEAPLVQSFVCRFDGLCAVEWRFVRPADELAMDAVGRLTLELALAEAPQHVLVRAAPSGDTLTDDGWTRFAFDPLPGSAGRRYHARLRLSSGSGRGPALWVADGVRFAAGATWHGATPLEETPVFRTFCRPPAPDGRVAAPGLADPLIAQLGALDRTIYAHTTELEADRRTLPHRLAARLWQWARGGPLPPLEARPWSPDAPPHRKLLLALYHYGPRSLAGELVSWLRWRGMAPEARADRLRDTEEGWPGRR